MDPEATKSQILKPAAPIKFTIDLLAQLHGINK
jgi:hypothetical protein